MTVTFGNRKFQNLLSLRKLCIPFKNFSRDFSRPYSHTVWNMCSNKYIDEVKVFVPKLMSYLHKGQCGRIGIIGGSTEYTGAPYFSAISALKLGADLVYVFCCKEAAEVIKSYSPELIVLPILDDPDPTSKIEPWLSRLHSLVIGPGLGREPSLLKNVGDIIEHCSKRSSSSLPLIIDADGLFLITENLYLVQNYSGPVILTPNAVEYKRLSAKFPNLEPIQVAKALNVVLLQKGLSDVITNGMCEESSLVDATIECKIEGSNRRCGGQGDILSGCLATLVAWFELYKQEHSGCKLKDFHENVLGYSWASYGACALTKTCNRLAFEKLGRSMTASDMIPCIHKSFTLYFGE